MTPCDTSRHIYQTLHQMLCDQRFDLIDESIKLIDVSIFPILGLVSMLTITACVRERLVNRSGFYQSVYDRVVVEQGYETAKSMLKGLE